MDRRFWYMQALLDICLETDDDEYWQEFEELDAELDPEEEEVECDDWWDDEEEDVDYYDDFDFPDPALEDLFDEEEYEEEEEW